MTPVRLIIIYRFLCKLILIRNQIRLVLWNQCGFSYYRIVKSCISLLPVRLEKILGDFGA